MRLLGSRTVSVLVLGTKAAHMGFVLAFDRATPGQSLSITPDDYLGSSSLRDATASGHPKLWSMD